MGYLQAVGYASAVSSGLCSLDMAVYGHLTGNMYPPCGGALHIAVAAIQAVAAGDDLWFSGFKDGVDRSAEQVVADLYLQPFVDAVLESAALEET